MSAPYSPTEFPPDENNNAGPTSNRQHAPSVIEAVENAQTNDPADRWDSTISRLGVKFPDIPLHQIIEKQVSKTPNAVAVRFENAACTYRDLNATANKIARHLVSRGVRPGDPVMLCGERTIDTVIGVLAILKAGAAYVPVDPESPPDRLLAIIMDCRAKLMLCNGVSVKNLLRERLKAPRFHEVIDLAADGNLWGRLDDHDLGANEVRVDPQGLAYIIYTSGSTGVPKAVAVEHRSLAAVSVEWTKTYNLRPGLVHLQMANFTFDVFAADLIRSLGSGGTMLICPKYTTMDGEQLYYFIERERASVGEFVPAVIKLLLRYIDANVLSFPDMETIAVGADTFALTDCRRLIALCGDRVNVFNTYGVTEAAVETTALRLNDYNLEGHSSVPIGRPIANTSVSILDHDLRPVRRGETGELFIGGLGVARGYLNRPEETFSRFIQSPFESCRRLYRTGDVGRILPDGNIEFLGRDDLQIKIRGFRIEPEEVEAAIKDNPGIQDAVVAALEENGETKLAAYVIIGNITGEIDFTALRRKVQQRLPAYMIPCLWSRIPEVPLSNNGKVDRRRLQQFAEPLATGETVNYANDTESAIAGLFGNVLGREHIYPDDDFFSLGGHSLLVIQILARLKNELDIVITFRDFFSYSTPRALAQRVSKGDSNVSK